MARAALSTAATASSRAIVNDTILGVAMQFASGVPINLRTNPGEINNDGIASDRPAGVPRNSLNLPARYNVDLRLSRQFRLGGARKAEVIAEVKNVFNTVQWMAVSNAAVPVVGGDRPADRARCRPAATSSRPSAGYEQRQFQIGFRFVF